MDKQILKEVTKVADWKKKALDSDVNQLVRDLEWAIERAKRGDFIDLVSTLNGSLASNLKVRVAEYRQALETKEMVEAVIELAKEER